MFYKICTRVSPIFTSLRTRFRPRATRPRLPTVIAAALPDNRHLQAYFSRTGFFFEDFFFVAFLATFFTVLFFTTFFFLRGT